LGHFAKIVDGKVTEVIVAEKEFFDTFVDSSPGNWLRTSYNMRGGIHYEPDSDTPRADQSMALRANYAGVGYTYDAVNDVFYPPRPTDKNGIVCASWTISGPTWLWQAPTPMPNDGKMYWWDEVLQSWETFAVTTTINTIP
jgi:hypothetical protein